MPLKAVKCLRAIMASLIASMEKQTTKDGHAGEIAASVLMTIRTVSFRPIFTEKEYADEKKEDDKLVAEGRASKLGEINERNSRFNIDVWK